MNCAVADGWGPAQRRELSQLPTARRVPEANFAQDPGREQLAGIGGEGNRPGLDLVGVPPASFFCEITSQSSTSVRLEQVASNLPSGE